MKQNNIITGVLIGVTVILLLVIGGLVYWNLSQRQELNEIVE